MGNLFLKFMITIYQIMGQLAITGLVWCDFLVLITNEECLIERIHYDQEFAMEMREKLELSFYGEFLSEMTKSAN